MNQPSIKALLETTFAKVIFTVTGSRAGAAVTPAGRPEFGDYQVNGVMSIARQLRTNPRELAQKVVSAMPPLPQIESLEIAGPGFINIKLSTSFLASRVQSLAGNVDSLIPAVPAVETIVIDYSSPNLAKEMHVGHLRGTIIGDCLVRILERVGHNVVRQNHVGDWGTQFGMLIAYMEGLASQPSQRLDTELADLEAFYRSAKEKFDKEPGFADRARACVVKLQSGDPDYTKIWQAFINESLRHCEAVYSTLNIRLQRGDLCPESFYNSRLPGIIKTLEDKTLLSVSDGAKVVFLPEFLGKDGSQLPVIVQKSDGGYLYATTDLAAIEFRSKELKADRVLYVVDARQSLHFQQVFAVAREAGLLREGCRLVHVAYGTMMGKDGRPFKTRSGDTVKLMELLEESIRRAHELVSSKNPDLDETTRQLIAKTVGIGSVKYADLSKNRTSDYVFDWDAMLSFDGNTAPYLLYAYTRIMSILKKQTITVSSSLELFITADAERVLALKILQFPEVLNQVVEDYLPSHLCSYLYELAVVFMRFYEACPILKADPEIRLSRLVLASVTADVMKQGLGLLGLETLDQM